LNHLIHKFFSFLRIQNVNNLYNRFKNKLKPIEKFLKNRKQQQQQHLNVAHDEDKSPSPYT
jgi:hypothetical protein